MTVTMLSARLVFSSNCRRVSYRSISILRISHRPAPAIISPCSWTANHWGDWAAAASVDGPRRSFGGKAPEDKEKQTLIYEGPFGSLTLKLKRLSLFSAVIAIVGLPSLSFLYGTGSVPAPGQLAVIATASITAVGSTALLSYCFSPYIHTMEQLEQDRNLLRATTRDILAREVVTVFDPKDVTASTNNARPFCNFMLGGRPFYVHPELVNDDKLRAQLVGEPPQEQDKKIRKDDDEFF